MPIGPGLRPLGFAAIFAIAVALVLALIAAALVLSPPWSWTIGFVYIAYDTWLLAHHVVSSRAALVHGRVHTSEVAESPTTLTAIIAAHNEGAGLRASVAALGDRPWLSIIVVDDGSEDGSGEALAEQHGLTWTGPDATGVATAASMDGRLAILRQPRSGKAGALNRALAQASGDIVLTIDADTVLEPGALEAMRSAFAGDPVLVAACGVLAPTCTGSLLAPAFRMFQAREYCRAFFWRLGWAEAGSLVLVSGAFAAYRRQALVEAGGFDETSLVEDYEMMYRLHARRPGLRARVVAAARATTDAPGSPIRFLRQRARWFAGFLATLWRYRRLVGDPGHGHLGTWHLRLKTLDTLLPLWGLFALAALAYGWCRQGHPDPLVLWAIAGKAAVDAALHASAESAYRRWLGQPGGAWRCVRDLAASLAEQVCFQPLRQCGAALGWALLLRQRRAWNTERGRP